jgi:succinylglutamate desuccinylase
LLNVLTTPPPNLFDLDATELNAVLDGPTLLALPGKLDPPLFVSVLLHGNETSGWDAMRRLAREELERGIVLFIGNIEAAAQGVRALPGQQDYNRVWRGALGPEGRLARQVLEYARDLRLFAALDIHNNTGQNPHYSVLTNLDSVTLNLAYMFSDHAVFVEEPDTVLSRALDHFCPSFTVEVGPVGDPQCVERTYDLLKRLLSLVTLEDEPCPGLRLYRSVARVHVADDTSFDFADHHDSETDLTFTAGIEAVNFHALDSGTEFGRIRTPLADAIHVLDPEHNDVSGYFFMVDGESLRLKRPITPAMFTTDEMVVRQDCLCYFMEEFDQ